MALVLSDKQLRDYKSYWDSGESFTNEIEEGKKVCADLLSERKSFIEKVDKSLGFNSEHKKKLREKAQEVFDSKILEEIQKILDAFQGKKITESVFDGLALNINEYSKLLQDFKKKFNPLFEKSKEINDKIQRILKEGIDKELGEISQKIHDGTLNFLATRYQATLYPDVVRQLSSDTSVSSQMVDFFVSYITERTKKLNSENEGPKMMVLGSWFVRTLAGSNFFDTEEKRYDYPKILQLLTDYKNKKKDIFRDFDRVLFVVNSMEAHWVLMIMDNKERTIGVADSITDDPPTLPQLIKIMNELRKEFTQEPGGNYYQEKRYYVPHQGISAACGIHVCKNIDLYMRNQPIDSKTYTQQDMSDYRRELLKTFAFMKLSDKKEVPIPFDKTI